MICDRWFFFKLATRFFVLFCCCVGVLKSINNWCSFKYLIREKKSKSNQNCHINQKKKKKLFHDWWLISIYHRSVRLIPYLTRFFFILFCFGGHESNNLKIFFLKNSNKKKNNDFFGQKSSWTLKTKKNVFQCPGFSFSFSFTYLLSLFDFFKKISMNLRWWWW